MNYSLLGLIPLSGVLFALLYFANLQTAKPFLVVIALAILLLSLLALFAFYGTLSDEYNQLLSLKSRCDSLLQKQDQDSVASIPELTEILEKALAELSEKIHESKRKEHSVLLNAVDVICVIGTDHKFVSVNPASKKAWGYDPEELKGLIFTELLVKDDVPKTLESLIGAEKSVDTLNFENRIRRKDGRVIDVLWSAHWSALDQAVFCVVHDITARKEAENLLRQSEKRVREIFERMPVGLLIVNQSGYIELGNPAIAKLAQCEEQELVGTLVSRLLPNLTQDFGTPDIQARLAEKTVLLADTSLLDKAGANCAVQVSLTGTTFQSKPRFLYIVLDVSEREEIEQAKRQFVAMVSHELRSPLTALKGVMHLLENGVLGELNEKGHIMVGRSKSETNRLVQLINDLLDVEKIRAGKFNLHLERTRADEIVAASINAVSYLAEKRDLKLLFESPAEDLECFADGGRLIQVLVNLISNAIKYSPKDSCIKIAVSKTENEEIVFSVNDSGRGIPEQKLDSIFLAYEQVQKNDASEHGGTGLGLPICKALIDEHKGKIWVNSKEGSGSTFFFKVAAFTTKSVEVENS